MRPALWLCCLLLIGGRSAAAGGDALRGELLYEARCAACHSLDHDRVGPRHRGVYGRRAASLAEFDYSPALRKSRVVWNETTLERWLADPEALIPGQKMGYRMDAAADRADVIAYLRRSAR